MLTEKNHPPIVCMLCTLCLFTLNSFGQEADKQYSATTSANPRIAVEDLGLLLKPLTKRELIVEAEAWLQLLKDKTQEVIEAAEKIEDEIVEIIQSDAEPTEKINKLHELSIP